MNWRANMVWHIFKKDVRLLWPFVLGAVGIQCTSAILRYAMDHIASINSALNNLSYLLQITSILANAFLIATVVQQDSIPGIRQDWLVRPIRRRDLLLAKLLFVLLVVHGPILLTDTAQALANGFPLFQSLAAAASRGLYLLIGLSIPVLAFASLTRNLTEAVIGAIAVFLVFAVLQILLVSRSQLGHQLGVLRETGLFWITESATFLVSLSGAIVILTLQYFNRKTLLARWGMVVVALLLSLVYLLPWRFAFALQQRLSAAPGASRSIAINFSPGSGKFPLPSGVTHNTVTGRIGELVRDEASTIYLPLHITGVTDSTVLHADSAQASLTSADGRVLYRGPADDLVVRKEDRLTPIHFTIGSRRFGFSRDIEQEDGYLGKDSVSKADDVLVYQGLSLPRNLYDRIKDQTISLEITYSLTLFRGSLYTIPALGGDVSMPGAGRCKTEVDTDGDEIRLVCVQAGNVSNCASAYLEDVSSGQRNPIKFSCLPNYAPYFGQFVPDALVRFGGTLPFRDASGLSKYPVDSSRLPQSQVVMRVYRPLDHFTRRIVVPNARLTDWESLDSH